MTPSLPGTTVALPGGMLHYVDVGRGPAVLFLHGLLGSHASWEHLVHELADDFRIVAPDLFGHGASEKTLGDYSLSTHAATLRDLLVHLGIDHVTLVGHSFGGGIALEFCYLFPERVQRLVLVSSGGLGRELSVLLRAPTLPGSEWVLPLLASGFVRDGGAAVGRLLGRLGLRGGADVNEAWRGFVSLGDADSRRAFLATARSVIDPGGQSVCALPQLPRLQVPTLLVWGGHDRMIPPRHAIDAAAAIPGAQVEIFERAGHFPHLDEPDRFARVLRDFLTAKTARAG